MGEDSGLRTEHAERGHALTLVFDSVLSKSITGYKVELSAAEESTGGGVRTLQRIRLLPMPPGSGAAVVVGEADTNARSAELRTLGHVQTIAQRRFGRDLPIDAKEYLAFVDRAKKVLEEFGLAVRINPHAPPPAPGERPRPLKIDPKVKVLVWTFTLAIVALLALAFVALR